jgi:hypothetical protein
MSELSRKNEETGQCVQVLKGSNQIRIKQRETKSASKDFTFDSVIYMKTA